MSLSKLISFRHFNWTFFFGGSENFTVIFTIWDEIPKCLKKKNAAHSMRGMSVCLWLSLHKNVNQGQLFIVFGDLLLWGCRMPKKSEEELQSMVENLSSSSHLNGSPSAPARSGGATAV